NSGMLPLRRDRLCTLTNKSGNKTMVLSPYEHWCSRLSCAPYYQFYLLNSIIVSLRRVVAYPDLIVNEHNQVPTKMVKTCISEYEELCGPIQLVIWYIRYIK